MKTYTTKAGATQYKPSMEELQAAASNMGGFCLACGNEATSVDPDARKDECEACGAHKVYGAEELALMGLFH